MSLRPSLALGIARVTCPVCEAGSDALATLDGGPVPSLVAFSCALGHTLKDLTPDAEGDVLTSAIDYLDSSLDALRDDADDRAYQAYRDDGDYGR